MVCAYLISPLVVRFDYDRIRAEHIGRIFNVYNVRFNLTGALSVVRGEEGFWLSDELMVFAIAVCKVSQQIGKGVLPEHGLAECACGSQTLTSHASRPT